MKPKPSPFKIETGVPLPAENRRSEEFVSGLKKLKKAKGSKEDESFVWDDNNVIYRIALRYGFKIRTRKENGTGYRVWRIK